MSIHENDTASVVTVTKSVVVRHGEETSREEIVKEGVHKLQTGRGTIEETDVRSADGADRSPQE